VVLRATEAGRTVVEETRRRRDAWLFLRLDELSRSEHELLTDAAVLLRKIADS
jgi:hypothetical protein